MNKPYPHKDKLMYEILWADWEVALLRKHWPNRQLISARTGRTLGAVKMKGISLGLRYNSPRGRRWMMGEVVLVCNSNLKIKTLCRLLNRSKDSILSARRRYKGKC